MNDDPIMYAVVHSAGNKFTKHKTLAGAIISLSSARKGSFIVECSMHLDKQTEKIKKDASKIMSILLWSADGSATGSRISKSTSKMRGDAIALLVDLGIISVKNKRLEDAKKDTVIYSLNGKR